MSATVAVHPHSQAGHRRSIAHLLRNYTACDCGCGISMPCVVQPPPNLILRMATPDDAPALASMIAEFAAYERLPNHSTAETLRSEMSSADKVFEAVLAIDNGVAVGFAVIFQTYSTFAAKRGLYLEDIFVREGHRNRGVASAILRFIACTAVERDLGRVEFTVLLWNTVAIEFFERFGATPTSAWTTYRLTGDWLRRLAAEHTGTFAAIPAQD